MEPVPQKVLNWLHRVLQPQYTDVTRTYNDAAIALGQWPTLRPSTEVFTFDNGQSALLLRLFGTVPVQFRGTMYAIPITTWVTYAYPREPPIAFVTPTQAMKVRPGQHVSGEGRVYHPYLAGWSADHSTIAELVYILQDIFSREPPVVAVSAAPHPPPQAQPSLSHPVPQQRPASQPPAREAAPPVPPLPPELNRTGSVRSNEVPRPNTSSPSQPPALPPKPFQEQEQPVHGSYTGSQAPAPFRQSLADERAMADRGSRQNGPTPPQPQRYNQPPPLPPQKNLQRQPSGHASSSAHRPAYSQQQQQPTPVWQSVGSPPIGAPGPPPPAHPQPAITHNSQYPPQYQTKHPGQAPPGPAQHYPPTAQILLQPRKLSPPRDLLSDPFDPPLPTQSDPLPAPPIPPNPEKDALLHTLSQTLTSRLHSALQTNDAAIPPLRAQHQALNAALVNLQREQQALSSLSSQIASNSEILNQAMRDADQCIARAQQASAPGVDEVLVAPTVVGQQLYDLVAEVQALAGAREVLGRALDRGRIGAEGWVKSVRGLAREEFLKRVLVQKAARGMGLVHTDGEGSDGNWI